MYLFNLILFSFLVSKGESARILAVFPSPSISHQLVYRPLTQELARRGHEVVVITTDAAYPKGDAPENLYEIDFHDLSYSIWKDVKMAATGNERDIIEQVTVVFEVLNKVIEKQLTSKEVQEIIKNNDIAFDLLIAEVLSSSALVFSHIYKVPVVQISSFGGISGTYDALGAVTQPNLYPLATRQKLYNITIWQNINGLYSNFLLDKIHIDAEENDIEMLRRVIDPNVPTIAELKKNVRLYLLNMHPLWDNNRPVPKNVIYIHGIQQKLKKDLTKDLKLYLDQSKNGVVYVSFGTNSQPSSFPSEKIEIFMKVFSQLQYDVLLKWDSDDSTGWSKNVKVGKWFPQSDLLRHPKIKAFVTQAGLQSTDEAIDAGVPLVGIPLLIDQWSNTEKYQFYKIGIKLNMETLTDETLKNAIETVIKDTSYRTNIAKLRSRMRIQKYSALHRAVWGIEHLLQHSGEHLRAPAASMHWTAYYELELVIIALCTLLALLFLISCSIRVAIQTNYSVLSNLRRWKSE